MKVFKSLQVLIAGMVVMGTLGARPAEAVERASDFLDGLRKQGYFDMAIDYLEQMRTSPLAPPEFKKTIDYEAGITLVAESRTTRSATTREKCLDGAREHFKTFLTAQANHPLVPDANIQLANVHFEWGKISVAQANAPGKTAQEKKDLLDTARKLLEDAHKAFVAAEDLMHKKSNKFPKEIPDSDKKALEERGAARADWMRSQLLLAAAVYELSTTYEPGSTQHKEQVTKAAKTYGDVYKLFGSSRQGGLRARLMEGRCFKELGDTAKALEILTNLTTLLPDEPEVFRILKNQTLVQTLETLLLVKPKPKYAEAITLGTKWIKDARGAEESDIEGLQIHFLTGRAAYEFAKTLKDDDPKSQENRRAAKKDFAYVGRFDGKYQQEAKALELELAGVKDEERKEPKNFVDARDRGKQAWEKMRVADLQDKAEAAEGKTENHERLVKQKAEGLADAKKYYRMAMGFDTSDVLADDLNEVRYHLCYLYYLGGDLYEAAVTGEFVAKNYPETLGAAACGIIAMASYQTLYAGAPKNDRQFETDQVYRLAKYVADRWPARPQAADALIVLVNIAIQRNEYAQAMQYLAKIPEDSRRRAEAELKTGAACWKAYVDAYHLPEQQRPNQATLLEMRKTSRQLLEQGIGRSREEVKSTADVSNALAGCILYMVQIYSGSDEPEKAVEWMDDEKIGLLKLIADGHEATKAQAFRIQAYKVALRTYVAVGDIEKAKTSLDQLQELVSAGGDAEAAKTLTNILISLAQDLEQSLAELGTEGKQEEIKKLSAGFEMFLSEITKRSDDFQTMLWVATTFTGLGSGLSTGQTRQSAEAARYFSLAAEAYQEMIGRCEKDPNFAPAGALPALQMRMAGSHRQAGHFKEAMAVLRTALEEKERAIATQIAAAEVYQAWGKEKPDYYLFAIQGSPTYRQVWGWGKIAKVIGTRPEYRHIYHQARSNLAECRLQHALTLTGDQRTEKLEQAQRDVTAIQQLYPKLGKEESIPEDGKATGLEAFRRYESVLTKASELLKKK
ncbi:MAG: hypothetical protein HQ581_08250 [Planctomycetes bacterium]|nr:hypothetical protein [Planctomycetota bacterium]